ncbi:MAG TPA: Gp138 family membrane-puncturing spike protein [Ramlibacter sp.]|jgi:hypothetical protein
MTGVFRKPNRGVQHDVVGNLAQDERFDIATKLPVQVVSFDPATQTAELKVLYKPRFAGKEVDFPNLIEVPVDQPRASGFAVTQPIKPGTQGIVEFTGRDQDNWYLEDGAQPSATARSHSYSDGRFVPGAHPKPKAMGNYDNENAFFGTDDHKNGVRVSPDGTVAIEGQGESLMAILSELLSILSGEDTNVQSGSSAGLHPLVHQPEYAALLARLNKMKLR